MTIKNQVWALLCKAKPVRFSTPYRLTKPLLSFIFVFSLTVSQAQTLRGTLRDADNGDAVTGATVTLRFSRGSAAPLSLASSPTGEFVFEKIRTGYYSLDISAQGFENQVIAEVNVVAGKEQVLDIALRRTTAQLAEVTILASQPGRRPLLALGEIPLTRDQTLRFPATFFDPARLAMAYPGVANADDQANGLSIRGNTQASVRWRLEGVDIVNPNHLSNAGTFSDRPAAASGGILLFSAQLLDNSSLLTGPMPAGYWDALGGIMDMNLRRGNNRQHEFTAQAGLIGLDLAAEGPMFAQKAPASGEPSAGKKVNGQPSSSYLVNYRYSTVGLLGQLGVSFGDEQINFQDLSFNLNIEGKRGGRWSVFGLGGLSDNRFKHKTDTAEIKSYKDFFDIDFKSKTGVLGLSNWKSVGKDAWLKTTLAYSAQTNKRNASSQTFSDRGSNDDIEETKISAATTFSQRLGRLFRFSAGISGTLQKFKAESAADLVFQDTSRHQYFLTQPWAQFSWNSRREKTTITLGLHGLYFKNPYGEYDVTPYYPANWEPRLSVSQKLAEDHRISLSAGLYSQIPPQWLLKRDIGLQTSRKVAMAYLWQINPGWSFRTEVYLQSISPAFFADQNGLSILNVSEFELLNRLNFNVTGEGVNKGVELAIERRLTNGWFLLFNGTFCDSKSMKFSGADALPTRWDIGHIANFVFGKEWQREKQSGRARTIGLNARVVWTGGSREMPILLAASKDAQSTIFDADQGFSVQNPDYFRIDLRVYWRKNLGNRRNSTFALDIQNLTGQQNFAYHYFDPYTGQIERKYQLGTIPNFSWRLEF